MTLRRVDVGVHTDVLPGVAYPIMAEVTAEHKDITGFKMDDGPFPTNWADAQA